MPVWSRGSSTAIEVEASSFSVWNCVITFIQILLISTLLYGAGWSQSQAYEIPSDNFINNSIPNFRAIAFFFSVWALQSIALSLLLVWAIGKRSYHLCHSWILCEILMQLFICLCAVYFTYHALLSEEVENDDYDIYTTPSPAVAAAATALTKSNDRMYTGIASNHHYESSFRPPKHLAFLIILHFFIKGFGLWIVKRYMSLIASTAPNIERTGDVETAYVGNGATMSSTDHCRRLSPPPSYDGLCTDELPCYDEALKLCLKDSEKQTLPITEDADKNNDSATSKDNLSCKSPLVPNVELNNANV